MKKFISAVVAASCVAVSAAAEETGHIEELVVVAFPMMVAQTAEPAVAPPAQDGGDFLRQIPGVSAGRFGGHSLEPVIRGLLQTQLTIMHDGAMQMGSGPNRMDAPSTYATIDLVDKVIVKRGYQSVLDGPGAVGGVIRFVRNMPEYQSGLWTKAKMGGAWESNGDVVRTFGRAAAGRGGMAIEAWGSLHQADNYKDGAGKEVRSAFNDYAAGGSFTLMSEDGAYLQATYMWNRMEDSLFPGAGMDSVLTGGHTYSVKWNVPLQSDVLLALRGEASMANTRHVMNNFALRDVSGPLSESRTNTDTINISLKADVDFSSIGLSSVPATIGFDFRLIENNGVRVGGMNADMLGASNAILWPGVDTAIVGVAFEQVRELSSATRLTYGVRSDWADVGFHSANVAADVGMGGMMPMIPNNLYNAFYGVIATPKKEHMLSGLLKLEWQSAMGTRAHGGFSRAGRLPDATERAFANPMMMNGQNTSWVGNPALRPEFHNQIEVGVMRTHDNWSGGLTGFINHVDDYVLRDSARVQPGILVNFPMADVYRNISARLTGIEAEIKWRPMENVRVNADVSYVRGQNLDQDMPLAQIPPLQGRVSVQHSVGNLETLLALRYALKQTRVDTDPVTGTGRDARATPGYAVFDARLRYLMPKMGASVQLGVRNIFDGQFADHLNRSNLLDASEVQVNEPGRNVYMKLVASF